MEIEYNNIKNPVLVRCEIDWFEDTYAADFQLSEPEQKKHDSLKKNPTRQRIYLRERKWTYILSKVNRTLAPEVAELVKRVHGAKNKGITFEVFANAIANLFETISNAVIHALKLGQKPQNVTILNKSPFDECANILIDVVSILPGPSNCTVKFESGEN